MVFLGVRGNGEMECLVYKWTPRMEMGDQQDTDTCTSKHATIAAASGLTLW